MEDTSETRRQLEAEMEGESLVVVEEEMDQSQEALDIELSTGDDICDADEFDFDKCMDQFANKENRTESNINIFPLNRQNSAQHLMTKTLSERWRSTKV
jgi:hypothetical protein